ncbi:MAG: TerB family tellurite resistance protein [Gammaproteobacteria bacterium]|nr:TerB family tellurite resistance protein [Gammaproteobacteria bacterium]MCZ6773207.1 TerB family tellurite resistance protein [Pseudomonadota bacterium]MCZ6894779.1 TerB family tellurite resistance protein [Gammaproteobacteria bacterium]
MFRTLKALFDDRIASYATADDEVDALPLAVAALLFEISRADHEVHEDERKEMVRAVGTVCELEESDIASLLETADTAVEEAVSLFDFTSVVNEHLNREKKYELLLLLWRIAYADGRLDRYEEYYIRKIADLLRLSHADFIRAKHAAAD